MPYSCVIYWLFIARLCTCKLIVYTCTTFFMIYIFCVVIISISSPNIIYWTMYNETQSPRYFCVFVFCDSSSKIYITLLYNLFTRHCNLSLTSYKILWSFFCKSKLRIINKRIIYYFLNYDIFILFLPGKLLRVDPEIYGEITACDQYVTAVYF